MPIDLDGVSRGSIANQGGLTLDTAFTGEISGNITSGLKLASMRGTPVSDDTIQEYEGYLKTGGELVPTRLVWQTLNTTGGTVQGNFDDGLNLKSIYGSALVDGQLFANNGEGITYHGGELYVTQLNPYRNRYVTSSLTETKNRDYLRVDVTLPNITIPCPSPASDGDHFYLVVVKGDPTVTGHEVTLTATAIEGDTSYIMDGTAIIQIVFNGDEWVVRA